MSLMRCIMLMLGQHAKMKAPTRPGSLEVSHWHPLLRQERSPADGDVVAVQQWDSSKLWPGLRPYCKLSSATLPGCSVIFNAKDCCPGPWTMGRIRLSPTWIIIRFAEYDEQ
jgi:hypothetical protein